MTVLVAALLTTAVAASAPSALEQQIYRSVLAGDYPRAAELVETFLRHAPHHPAMLYNAACIYSRLGQIDRGASSLRRAVEAGLTDLGQIERDADLVPLRDHPVYKAVIRRLTTHASNKARDAISHWRRLYGDEQYRYSRDEDRRIAYATALDRTSHEEMRRMIERQVDYLQASIFDTSPATFLLIAIPTPSDARQLFNNEHTGGIYEHVKRRVISRDTGSSLRHELVHAYHYAHMDRLGQRHPLWIQEGLAALHESYVIDDDGTITYLPNERHDIVRGLVKAGRLRPWKRLFGMADEDFMDHAKQHYPQVRSIFEFIADQGKLQCWYDALVEFYEDDRSGELAFNACFDRPLGDIERAWRRWVLDRPPLDIFIQIGDAALGIESNLRASNDGVLITRVIPGLSGANAGLRVGDVIVAVDDQSTRSLSELQTIIAGKKVGESVSIRARRRHEYFTVVVLLQPYRR